MVRPPRFEVATDAGDVEQSIVATDVTAPSDSDFEVPAGAQHRRTGPALPRTGRPWRSRMPLELMTDLPDNVVGVRAIGEVDEDDYEDVLEPAIEDRRGRHDKIRFLYVLGTEFTGYESDAMWEDFKQSVSLRARLRRRCGARSATSRVGRLDSRSSSRR